MAASGYTGNPPGSGGGGGGAVDSVNGRTGAVVLSKTDVSLANVDNTADAAKPVSTAQATALALKAPLASPTFTGTVAGVTAAMVGADPTGTATAAVAAHVAASDPHTQYQFSSADLTAIDNLTPGAGDVIQYTAGAWANRTPAQQKVTLSLDQVTNTSDAAKPVSTAQQTALNLKADLASPTFTGNPVAPTQTAGNNTTRLATTAFVTAAVAAGGGGGTAPEVAHGIVTSGNLTAPNDAGWTLLAGFTAAIAAVAGDEVEFVLTGLFDLNASRTDKFELCTVVSGAIGRYASTGTSSPAGAGDGDSAISNSTVQFLGVQGLPMTITVAGGDLDAGNVTFGIAHKGPGGGKVFADGATYPLRWRVRNDH